MSFFKGGKSSSGSGEGSNIQLSNAIDSTSTETAASSFAIKQVNDKVETKADKIHNHDTEYYTKSEIDNSINSITDTVLSDQYKIKTSPEDVPSYLSSKVDNVTLSVEDNELKVKNVDGLIVGIANLNTWLSGTSDNIQNQIDGINSKLSSVTAGMSFIGKFETHAELMSVGIKKNGDLAVVLVDENKANGRSMYVYSENFGMWDFIGAFTFADEFIELTDTPNSYVGHNGKVLKVDEANNKVTFNNIDYSEIENKPSSTITQIDQSVQSSHSHPNKALLDTYNQTNIDISNAVTSTHVHSNKASLDKLGVNANGELTINGVVYTPKIPSKKYLYARRSGGDQVLEVGDTCIFSGNKRGDIPYDTTTGLFTLEAGKTYRVTVTASMLTEGYLSLHVTDFDNVEPHPNSAIWTDVTRDWREASAGSLEVVLMPSITKDFKVKVKSINGSSKLRAVYSVLVIQEL